MDRKAIVTKTAKGMREASGTKSSLARDLRAVLQAVDGKSTADELARRLDQLAEPALEQMLDRLATEGYVREIPASPQDTDDALDLDFTRAAGPSNPPQESEPEARRKAKATVKRWAEERTKRRAEEKARSEAERQAIEAEKRALQEAREQARLEAERSARELAEAQGRRLAVERTVREAEERAKRAAEAAAQEAAEQAKRETEERARREAAEQTKRETEERARREAAERAAQEAEEVVRRAKEQARRAEEQARRAEEQARRESEARAAAEAAERAVREAEELARREAEELARRLAEELARREAEDAARREAEETTRRQVEERTRREAEEAARHAVEEAARREAEERARRQAEEAARREAEEQARRLAEELARREAEESARREAEEKSARREAEESARRARESARREAEERDRREAEQRAQRQAERQASREAAQQARRAAREKALGIARDRLRGVLGRLVTWRAESKARREIPAAAEDRVHAAAPGGRRRSMRRGRTIAFAALASLAGALALLHLMSFDSQVARFESAAAAHYHQPVTIQAVRFSLFWRPHWSLEGVTIGAAGQIRAPRVRLYTALFGDEPAFKAIEADAPVLTEEGLGWLVLGKAHGGGIGRLDARGVLLASESLGMPKFDVSAQAGADASWRNVHVALAGTDVDLTLTPEHGAVRFSARSNRFEPSFLAAMPALADFQAEGVVEPDGLRVTRFEGSVGGGVVSGSARLNVGERAFEGDVAAKNIDMARAIHGMFESGMLDGSGSFGLPLGEAGKAPSLRLAGNFAVRRGILGGIDLGSMLKDTGRGGSTNFASLEGEVAMADGEVQLRQLRLGAGALSAKGSVAMSKDRSLHGRIELDVGTATMRRRGALELSGSFAEPYAQNAVWTRR